MDESGSHDARPVRSLVEGVEQAVCNALGIKNLRHKSALFSLEIPPGVDIANVIFDVIHDNWVRSGAASNQDRSQQNWRWVLQTQIGQANRSPEVVLERAVAAACSKAGRTDWANQIPVASGLVPRAADGRRAIDLAHRRRDGSYELIELKMASDTPLYAAVELVSYGCLWLLARCYPPTRRPQMLNADVVHLRVLAPAQYYDRFDLSTLERSLNAGLQMLGSTHAADMTFAYDVLPDKLCTTPLPVAEDLLNFLVVRTALRPGA